MALHSLSVIAYGPPSIKSQAAAHFSPIHHVGPHSQPLDQHPLNSHATLCQQQQQHQEHHHQLPAVYLEPEEISPSIHNSQLFRISLEYLQYHSLSRSPATTACSRILALPPSTVSYRETRPSMEHCCLSSSAMEFQPAMIRPQISPLDDEENFSPLEDGFTDLFSAMRPNPRFYIPSNGDEGIRNVPLPGVRCPKCAKDGKEVWVIPGRACGYCGTACV